MHISLSRFSLCARHSARLLTLALFAVVAVAPAAVPVRAVAQDAAAHHHHNIARNPAATETPNKEERQVQGFLNAPVVHHLSRLLHVDEPTGRTIFLAINFALIFFAIAIPLVRMMPKIFRKRSQTLRSDLETARSASEEARQRMSAVEAKLAGLDEEIAAFRAQVEQESVEDEKRIKNSMKDECDRILASAEQEIGAASALARRELRAFAANLAIEHAEKQLSLTPEADRALIGEFIEQLEGEIAVQTGEGVGGLK